MCLRGLEVNFSSCSFFGRLRRMPVQRCSRERYPVLVTTNETGGFPVGVTGVVLVVNSAVCANKSP
jgi:hypothetical protein